MVAYTRSLLEPLTATLEWSQRRMAELERDTGRLIAELERATSTVVTTLAPAWVRRRHAAVRDRAWWWRWGALSHRSR